MAVMSTKYVQPELDKLDAQAYHVQFEPESLADAHFSKGKLVDTPKGNRLFNTIFSLLAVFILLVALLNYVNLSTARADERAKEVAVRKVVGASPLQLMGQFIGESFFLIAIAWLAAIGMAELTMPFFNRLLSAHISLGDTNTVWFLALLFPLTALLAGAWPAFVLSGFQPIRVLKGLSVQSKGIGLRKVLTVVQFIVALAMLMGTVVIYLQMHYMLHKDLGADRSNVMALNIPEDGDSHGRIDAFRRAVQQESGVLGVSVGSGIPIEGVSLGSSTMYTADGRKRELVCNFFFIDPQFLPLLHIGLAEGRNLSASMQTDKKEAVLVNQAFLRALGWRSGVGQPVEGFLHKGKVVGVVKDFFYKSLHNVIGPVLFRYADTSNSSTLLVKAAPSVLPALKGLWTRYFPSDPFNYYFLDESFASQYKDDQTTMTLFNGFTLLAIFISCLGLYGLVSLITAKRTREIGVRKVLGASGRGLALLLTREFFWLIGCAALVALPLAGWGLQGWLDTYAYHISLTAWMFVLPLLLLVIITLSVTGLRVTRAVLTNPVESLKVE
jgi:putative ABC transport system permease protein